MDACIGGRRQLRIGALEGDAPRSFFKRWFWKRKTARFRSEKPSGTAQSAS